MILHFVQLHKVVHVHVLSLVFFFFRITSQLHWVEDFSPAMLYMYMLEACNVSLKHVHAILKQSVDCSSSRWGRDSP